MFVDLILCGALMCFLNSGVYLLDMRDVRAGTRGTRQRGVPAIPSTVTRLEQVRTEAGRDITIPARLLGGRLGDRPRQDVVMTLGEGESLIVAGVVERRYHPNHWTRVIVDGGTLSEEEITRRILGGPERDHLESVGYRLSNLRDREILYEVGDRSEGAEGLTQVVHLSLVDTNGGQIGALRLDGVQGLHGQESQHYLEITDLDKFKQVRLARNDGNMPRTPSVDGETPSP